MIVCQTTVVKAKRSRQTVICRASRCRMDRAKVTGASSNVAGSGNSLAANKTASISMAHDYDNTFSGRSRIQASSVAIETPPSRPGSGKKTFNSLVESRIQELIQEARDQIVLENWQAAETKLTRAIGMCNSNPVLYDLRGDVSMQMTDFKSAALNYEMAILHIPDSSDIRQKLIHAHYLHGQSLYSLALFESALAAYEEAIAVDPNCPLVYHGCRLSCLALLGRYNHCMNLVNGVLAAYGDNADMLVARARLHKHFGRDNESFYDLQAALEIDIEHKQAIALLEHLQEKALGIHSQAIKLSLDGKYEDALQKVSTAITADPAAATYHVLRGAIHRRLGNYPAAVDDFLLAKSKVGFSKKDSEVHKDASRHLSLTYNELAVECFHKKYYNEAIVLLNKALGEEKAEPGIYINRGDCFYHTGELDFANADYEQALLLNPGDWAVRGRLAIANCQLGAKAYEKEQYEESLRKFNAAIKVQPVIAQAYGQRARIHYMLKKLPAARMDILAALYIDDREETAISLASRIFPGDSTALLLRTAEGGIAGARVETALAECNTASGVKRVSSSTTMDKLKTSLKNILGDMPELSASKVAGHSAPGKDALQHKKLASTVEGESSSEDHAGHEGSQAGVPPPAIISKHDIKKLATPAGEDSLESWSKNDYKFAHPRTKLSAVYETGVPVPDRAMPSLKICLADHKFNAKLVEAKKMANRAVDKLLSTRPPLQVTVARLPADHRLPFL